MKSLGVKINYLYNSGFTLETKNHFLVFDYYLDSVESGEKKLSQGAIGREDLKIDKKIIVFSSHSHGDHFNPVILGWLSLRSDINYILSSDITLDKVDERIRFISPCEELAIDDVYVKAYGSTDIGVSFLVKVDGITVFHAGDLNWWYWWDDTEENIKEAESCFKKEIEKINGEKIDIAFFPVDPRLEHNYYLGGEYFAREINPEFLIPMHFREGFEVIEKFKEKIGFLPVKVAEINRRGEEILL